MNETEYNYLKNLSKRVEHYISIRKKAIAYITKNKISNKNLCVHLLLMSAVWSSHQKGEILSESDLEIFFGLKADSQEEFLSLELAKLTPEQENLTLIEIFDLTVATFR